MRIVLVEVLDSELTRRVHSTQHEEWEAAACARKRKSFHSFRRITRVALSDEAKLVASGRPQVGFPWEADARSASHIRELRGEVNVFVLFAPRSKAVVGLRLCEQGSSAHPPTSVAHARPSFNRLRGLSCVRRHGKRRRARATAARLVAEGMVVAVRPQLVLASGELLQVAAGGHGGDSTIERARLCGDTWVLAQLAPQQVA